MTKLNQLAVEENDEECMLRIKRKTMDCCRLYVGQVGNATIPYKEKIKYLDDFAKSDVILNYWDNYPVECIPVQQRVFQKAMMTGNYGFCVYSGRLEHTARKFRASFPLFQCTPSG